MGEHLKTVPSEKTVSGMSMGSVRNVQMTPHELGFRIFHGPSCGYPSCCRTNTHLHCKMCGYGTSQISNGVTHRRICNMNIENQSKEFSRLSNGNEPSLLQHDTIVRSSQSFPYYSTIPQTPVSVALSSQSSSNQSSKIITTQPSAMFNFVLPTQNAQFNGLYGTQNVFPNPNMFSPSSFNGFSQLDPWLPQPRLIPPGVHSGNNVSCTPEMLSNQRNHYEKMDTSNSPSSHGCCGRIESTAIGMCSPLTAEAYKVAKELTNFTTKIDSQNWYCNPQNMMGYGMQNSQQTSCKYSDPFPSCSVSQISLLLLEQTDMRPTEECINVEDLCFDSPQGKNNDTKPTSEGTKIESKTLEKDAQITSVELENPFSNSCMQTKSKIPCEEEIVLEKTQQKIESSTRENMRCMNGRQYLEQSMFPSSFSIDESRVGMIHTENETSSSSDESDIIVEESDEEVEKNDVNEKQFMPPKCLVCDKTATLHSFNFIKLQEDSPVTTTTHVSIMSKLSEVINHNFSKLKNCYICKRCLNLINIVDCLEIKLIYAKKELNDIFKTGKDISNLVLKQETTEKSVCLKEKEAKQESENSSEMKNINQQTHLVDDCMESKIKEKLTVEEVHCVVCDKNFSSAYYLQKHRQHHTKAYSYYCERCGKGFTLLKKLDNHLLLHSESSRYQCEFCGKRFIQKHVLSDHLKQHRGEFKYKCTYCMKGFMRNNTYTVHLRLHTKEKPFICQRCGRLFNASSNLKAHIQICSNTLQFSCLKCDKKFALKSLLEKHVALKHDNNFKIICHVCGKGFIKKSDLVKHMRSHSNKKPHTCSACGNSYKSLSNLNQHMKIHSGKNVLKCDICNKEFSRKDALDDHMNHHLGKKPYTCTKCPKTFANRLNLHTHNKKHEGKLVGKPCTVCGKLFVNGMKDHMRTHSGEKPFSCDKCGTLFTVKSSLNKHLKMKHEN